MENIKVIGLGGIGSELIDKMSKFLNYSNVEANVCLVDGDEYEPKNRERQEFSRYGNKARIKENDLKMKYPKLQFSSLNCFVDESTAPQIFQDGDIVFLAVDNHKTRKIVSKEVERLENCLLISGGNELTDGNVQIYLRKDGKNVTPSLTDYHPEIEHPEDKLPSEMGCEELHNAEPQLLFTNVGVATIMCWAYYNVKVLDKTDYSEVYFDIQTMKSESKVRKLKS